MSNKFKIAILLGSLIVLVPLALNNLRLRSVSINPQSCLGDNNLQIAGKFLFTIDTSVLESNFKDQFPCAADIEITKAYPSTLEILVEVRQPVLGIAETQLFVTQDGLIVLEAARLLPQLFLPSKLNLVPGQKVTSPEILIAAQIASLINKTDFTLASLRFVNGDLVLYDPQGLAVILSKDKDPKLQVDSLQQVLAKAKIDDANLAKIDLRFDKPVLTFK